MQPINQSTLPPATLILRDYLRRWRWVWAIILIADGAILACECLATPQPGQFVSFFPIGMFMGAVLLGIDFKGGAGGTRVILSLPVTAKELALTWWRATVLWPALALLLVNTLVFLAVALTEGVWDSFPVYLNHSLANLLLLGTLFFALTGLPANQCQLGTTLWAKLPAMFFSMMWGFTFGGWFIFAHWFDGRTFGGRIFIAVLVVLNVCGWCRRELLVERRSGWGRLAEPPAPTTRDSRCAEGAGGLGFLVRRTYGGMMRVGLGFTAMLILVYVVIYGVMGEKMSFAGMVKMMSAMPFLANGFFVQGLLVMQMFPLALQMRFLRTLPVSGSRLAAVLVFTPLAAMLSLAVVFGAIMVLAGKLTPGQVLGWVGQSNGLSAGFVTLFIPVYLLRGGGWFNWFMYVVFLAGMIFSMVGPTLFKYQLPAPVSLAIGGGLALAAYLLARYAVERSSRTYRAVPTAVLAAWGGQAR